MAEALSGKLCSTPNCGKPSKLMCPKCVELNISSPFCSQDCFKGNYKAHNEVHKAARFKPPPFDYTGELRPHYVTSRRVVPPHINRPDYADHIQGVSKSEQDARRSKVEEQDATTIEKIRVASKLGREVLDIGARAVRVGVTTDEIDRVVHEACVERNCYPSPLNYYTFPKSVCTSVNEIICHGIPDMRELQDGDICNIDVSVYHDGVHSDLNETYFVGNVDDESKMLVKTAKECLDKALELCQPGTMYRELGRVIEKHAKSNGCSVVRTYCGHGVGTLFHCAPNVPHYQKNKAPGVMKPGHVFTIEPMINLGSWNDVTWPDDWTSSTRDGKRSAQFEHTLVITETGYEVLTGRFPDSPFSVQ